MIESILTGLAGGGTGLLGSVVGRVFGVFEQREKNKERKIENEHELRLLEIQLKEKAGEREHEMALADMDASTKALVGSYDHDRSLVKTTLRWVRPGLTVLLIFLTALIFYTIADDVTQSKIAEMITYYTGMSVGWWFADRSGNKEK